MLNKKFNINSFADAKKEGHIISMLTAYDYTTAKLLDEAGVDCILVGDSLGMVILGYENTLHVTMDDMIHHTKAVSRGTKNAFIIGDMPFLSYHTDIKTTVENAGRFIQEAGAQAVKLERGREIINHIKAIINAQIPVLGHLGLTPQSVNIMGGYKIQGKSADEAAKLIEDAEILQDAGVFGLVLECVPESISRLISEKLDIPTIGIGAGRYCDGQVLVVQDMLGMYKDITPKFVKKYAEMGTGIVNAVQSYIEDLNSRQFPEEKHTFQLDDSVLKKLY
ncbi:3-methyl-2-oxobutanoate hydroxymethyltransferase [bacterium]|nr:3-methyl-2-oxobutanoate hydroxymethyltransferase [bacterium]